jgi:hypothetical protein
MVPRLSGRILKDVCLGTWRRVAIYGTGELLLCLDVLLLAAPAAIPLLTIPGHSQMPQMEQMGS